MSIMKYAKFFSAEKFNAAIGRFGRNIIFVRKAVMLFLCFQDPDTPKFVKAVIAGALAYLILPIDFLPDSIPGLGWIDDAAVIAIAMKVANRYIKPIHREKAQKYMPIGSD